MDIDMTYLNMLCTSSVTKPVVYRVFSHWWKWLQSLNNFEQMLWKHPIILCYLQLLYKLYFEYNECIIANTLHHTSAPILNILHSLTHMIVLAKSGYGITIWQE